MVQLRHRLPVLAVLARAGVPPVLLLAGAAMPHVVMFGPVVHMIVVGAAGVLAGTASVVMSIVATRRNDGRAVWLGMALSVMATVLVIHALATPGVILPGNGLLQVAGALNLPIGGTILAASALPLLRRPRRVWLLLMFEFAVVGLFAAVGVTLLAQAGAIPVVPAPSSLIANLIFVAGAIPLAVLAWRAARTSLLTRRVLDLVVAQGVVCLIGAVTAASHSGRRSRLRQSPRSASSS
jgi:hypothetical protein